MNTVQRIRLIPAIIALLVASIIATAWDKICPSKGPKI